MKLLLGLAICLIVFSNDISAQTCTILVTSRPFKIRLARTTSSATARVSDYVQFNLLEDVYSTGGKDCPAVLIPKDTSIFGVVTRRKHRHFPFKNGELEVQLEPMKIWDGSTIPLTILRHPPIAGTKPPKACKNIPSNCLAGRKNATVAPVVAATAATGSVVVAAVADSAATRVVAASGLFTLLSQGEIGDLLNGTDASLEDGEVFDMLIPPNSTVAPPPKDPE